MNGTTLTTICREVDVDFFRAIRPVVRLMEGEGQRHGGPWWDDRRGRRGDCHTWTILAPSPELGCSQACGLQLERFVVPYRMTLIMIPDDKYITDRERPGIWISDGHCHRIISG